MEIAVRELKARLSQVLSLARGGEVILVTSHNKPVARIEGIPPAADEGLRRLMTVGALSWNGGKPTFGPPVELSGSGTAVSQMVLEDRR